MAREEWTHIRLRRETKDRLDVFLASLAIAHEQGKLEGLLTRLDVITADTALNILLDRDARKKERARKSRSRIKREITLDDIGSASSLD